MGTDRNRKLIAKKNFKKPVTRFIQIDLQTVPFLPRGMTRAYTNNRFVVMIFDHAPVSTGEAIQVLVQRHDNLPILGHWAEMQKIKNEIFGEETTAVEYYPAVSELVDDFNIYWLWIFPDGVLPKPLTRK